MGKDITEKITVKPVHSRYYDSLSVRSLLGVCMSMSANPFPTPNRKYNAVAGICYRGPRWGVKQRFVLFPKSSQFKSNF